MEYWDLYNKNRQKINKIVRRGDKLQDDEYHLVVNLWIKNSKNEFLISQRAENKTYPFMWECTGGSVLKGEDSLDAALRESKEELGIKLDRNNGKLIGTTLRHYPNCPDIFDVWIFKCDISIEDVVCQKEEVCNVMWATAEQIENLYNESKFESNPFFKEDLSY